MKAAFKKEEFGIRYISGEGEGGGRCVCWGKGRPYGISNAGTQLGEKCLITSVLNMWPPGPAPAAWGRRICSRPQNEGITHCIVIRSGNSHAHRVSEALSWSKAARILCLAGHEGRLFPRLTVGEQPW